MNGKFYTFLSQEWVRKLVAAIEQAKSTDENLRSLASEFSLSVVYVVKDLPDELKKHYNSDEVMIYVELDRGVTKQFTIGTEIPAGKNPDFTVESTYDIAKKIFKGELTVASAFVRRQVKVKPLLKMYADPAFTAKSLMTFNVLLKVMGAVPTVFPSELSNANS